MMRFDLFNAFLPLSIDDIQITCTRHRLLNLTILSDDVDATPARLDSLMEASCPDIHRSFLFTYSVFKSPPGAPDTSKRLDARQNLV